MEEKRPFLKRSMLILLTKNSVLQIEQGDLLKQDIQTRSSEDSKSLNVEQTHDRTGRPVTDTAAVQDDSLVYREADTLNIDEEVLRERMEKSIVVHDESHESDDGERGRHGLPNSRTTTFRCETRAKYMRSRID